MNYNNQLPPEILEIDRRRKQNTRIIVIVVIIGVIFLLSAFIFSIFSLMGSSDAYTAAKEAIKKDQEIKRIVGDVKDISMTSGNIKTTNGFGNATFTVEVEGNNKEVDAYIELKKRPTGEWEVVEVTTE